MIVQFLTRKVGYNFIKTNNKYIIKTEKINVSKSFSRDSTSCCVQSPCPVTALIMSSHASQRTFP